MRFLLPFTFVVVLVITGCGDQNKPAEVLKDRAAEADFPPEWNQAGASQAGASQAPESKESVGAHTTEPAPTAPTSTEPAPAEPASAEPAVADNSAAELNLPAAQSSPAITQFLSKFDVLSAKGFVPTLRSGSTGIGYTLETMLGIAENNSPGGDFMGMELKAFRDDDLHMHDSEKMNLFLKEPTWIDGLTHAERVKKYGYIDENGRQAMYSTVQIKRNSHGWIFRIAKREQTVFMRFHDEDVAFWTFDVLKKRLLEKHSETVFVAAHARGVGKQEEFHYYSVTWCRDPAIDAFIDLIETGNVLLELRMHIKPSGSVRNHGSAFRIKQNKLSHLYRDVDQLRPTANQ